MAGKYCKFHISGLYHERKKNVKKANAKVQQKSMPFLLVKNRKNGEEYLIPDCQGFMRIGEISEAYAHLKAETMTENQKYQETNNF